MTANQMDKQPVTLRDRAVRASEIEDASRADARAKELRKRWHQITGEDLPDDAVHLRGRDAMAVVWFGKAELMFVAQHGTVGLRSWRRAASGDWAFGPWVATLHDLGQVVLEAEQELAAIEADQARPPSLLDRLFGKRP